MRYRNGFISNSSSTSFICEITGMKMSGYSDNWEEAGFYKCQNNHLFLNDYIPPMFLKQSDLYSDKDAKLINEKYCPICNWTFFSRNELADLVKKNADLFEYVGSYVRKNFANRKEFIEYLYPPEDDVI